MFDVKPYLDAEAFEPLKDQDEFKRVLNGERGVLRRVGLRCSSVCRHNRGQMEDQEALYCVMLASEHYNQKHDSDAMVRDFLRSVADRDAGDRERTIANLESSFHQLAHDMGERFWTRDELHERGQTLRYS